MNSRSFDICRATARWLGVLAIVACHVAPVFAAPATSTEEASEVWPVSDLRTSIAFRHDLLRDLGLAVRDVKATGDALEHHSESVSAGRDQVFAGVLSPSLELRVTRHVPLRFHGVVSHQGGFNLVGEAGFISFQPFSIRSGAEARTLEVLSADGAVMFYADHMHFDLERERGRLRSFNLDLRLAPALTERLEAPELTGAWVGTLALEASFAPQPPLKAVAGCSPPEWSGEVDVQLTRINNVDRVLQSGGLVGIAPSAELKNVGTADVPWWQKFSGPNAPYDNDQHPFLVWALYRMTDEKLEQLAVSDVKHAFLTLNFGCAPGEDCNSHILGLECEDVYGSSTNDSRSHLSYRDELETRLGLWDNTGSHFDPDDDGVQEHPPQMPDGSFDHRLLVPETELATPGATYWMQAWYIIRDDVDIYNSMAYRQVNPSQSGGGTWSFPTSGGTINGSILDEWVPPISPPIGSANTKVSLSGGHLQLAVRITSLGDGSSRYEYVLANHDFDAQGSAFSVPISGLTPTDMTFHDLDDDPSNDWEVAVDSMRLSWQLPAGASGSDSHTGGVGLDWGMTYTFGFTVEGEASATGLATMQSLAGGAPERIEILVPEVDSSLIFTDGFESGDVSDWSSSVP